MPALPGSAMETHPHSYSTARGRRRQMVSGLRRLLALALLVAFLPSLSFMGHWDIVFFGRADDVTPASAWLDLVAVHAEELEHSEHCHTDLASCVAQPLPAGLGLLALHEALLRPPPLRFARYVATNATHLPGRNVRPLTPPPRPR